MAAPIFEKLTRSYENVATNALLTSQEPEISPYFHEIQSTFWTVASCVACVASAFFFAMGTLAAFSIVTLTGAQVASYLLLPLVTVMLLRYPVSWSEQHQNTAETLSRVADRLKTIEGLSETDLRALLCKHHINAGRISRDRLTSPSFKMLLAYYLHILEKNEDLTKSLSKENFPYLLSEPAERSEIYAYHLVRSGFKEFIVWRNKIHAACFAQKIYKGCASIDLDSMGILKKMTLGERHANQLQLGAQSSYFTFKGNKRPILIGEMDGLSIEQIRQRIFD